MEVFYQSQRVASHARASRPATFRTVTEHMPPQHRHHAEWTPERLIRWGEQTGPCTAQLMHQILLSRAHVQQGFRACLGIMRLGKSYGAQRLEAAAQRALKLGSYSYKSLESILSHGLDQQPLASAEEAPSSEPIPPHRNLRGARYFH